MNVLKIYHHLQCQYGEQGWWPVYVPTAVGTTPGRPVVMTHDLRNMTHKRWRVEHGLTYGVAYRQLKQHQTSFRDPYFEIAVGAILTQNTAWRNVAAAIENLYRAKALTPGRLLRLPPRRLQSLIRPTGYYKQKAKKLRLFSRWLIKEHEGYLKNLKKFPLPVTRYSLLKLWGIGPETADSILLYALNKPIFVVDEYTRRLCRSYRVEFDEYDEYHQYFEKKIQKITKNCIKLRRLYQEYHALIVAWGKGQRF